VLGSPALNLIEIDGVKSEHIWDFRVDIFHLLLIAVSLPVTLQTGEDTRFSPCRPSLSSRPSSRRTSSPLRSRNIQTQVVYWRLTGVFTISGSSSSTLLSGSRANLNSSGSHSSDVSAHTTTVGIILIVSTTITIGPGMNAGRATTLPLQVLHSLEGLVWYTIMGPRILW